MAALRTGKPVVLVIANPAPAKPTDEAYGDWADALNTVSYEIATRFGGRLPRSYLGVA